MDQNNGFGDKTLIRLAVLRAILKSPIFLLAILWSSYACSGQYQAGYAKAEITPKIGDKVGSITGRLVSVKDIYDPLFVKALTITDGASTVAIVVVDVISLSQNNIDAILHELRDERGFDHVILAVSHTHRGMLLPRAMKKIERTVVDTVVASRADIEAVEIGAGQIEIDEAYNRIIRKKDSIEMLWTNPQRVPNRYVDNSLGVIHLRKMDGAPFFTLLNYTAHPVVTMDINNTVISGDYPNALINELNQTLGGESMFLIGASGDVNPYDAGTTPAELALPKAQRLGEKLAEAAAKSVMEIDSYTSEGKLRYHTKDFRNPDTEIGVLMLAPDIAMATFPGEYFNAFGVELKKNSPAMNTFFVGKANGAINYVPTVSALSFGGYGAEKDRAKFAEAGYKHIDFAVGAIKDLLKETEQSQTEKSK